MRVNPCWVGQLREQGLAASRRLLDELGHCETQLRTLGVKYGQHSRPNRNRPRKENFLCALAARRSRGLARGCHRPPAIERHLLKQAAMFISSTSALKRITDFDEMNIARSEEHTSELQSHSDLVCRLLLEKKNKTRSDILRRT